MAEVLACFQTEERFGESGFHNSWTIILSGILHRSSSEVGGAVFTFGIAIALFQGSGATPPVMEPLKMSQRGGRLGSKLSGPGDYSLLFVLDADTPGILSLLLGRGEGEVCR